MKPEIQSFLSTYFSKKYGEVISSPIDIYNCLRAEKLVEMMPKDSFAWWGTETHIVRIDLEKDCRFFGFEIVVGFGDLHPIDMGYEPNYEIKEYRSLIVQEVVYILKD